LDHQSEDPPADEPQYRPRRYFYISFHITAAVSYRATMIPFDLLQFAFFLKELVKLDAHVTGYSVRLLIVKPPAEIDATVKAFEKIEAGLTIPDMLLEYKAFFFIKLFVDVFRQLLEYLLAVLALVMFVHVYDSVFPSNFLSSASRIKSRAR
jgi:hypothetical protein